VVQLRVVEALSVLAGSSAEAEAAEAAVSHSAGDMSDFVVDLDSLYIPPNYHVVL